MIIENIIGIQIYYVPSTKNRIACLLEKTNWELARTEKNSTEN
uniref:Uncharacterized protein n=1 Tax=Arundo donax TaxID=35708 RepID=A0A0A9BYJ1_ARUDO